MKSGSDSSRRDFFFFVAPFFRCFSLSPFVEKRKRRKKQNNSTREKWHERKVQSPRRSPSRARNCTASTSLVAVRRFYRRRRKKNAGIHVFSLLLGRGIAFLLLLLLSFLAAFDLTSTFFFLFPFFQKQQQQQQQQPSPPSPWRRSRRPSARS